MSLGQSLAVALRTGPTECLRCGFSRSAAEGHLQWAENAQCSTVHLRRSLPVPVKRALDPDHCPHLAPLRLRLRLWLKNRERTAHYEIQFVGWLFLRVFNSCRIGGV